MKIAAGTTFFISDGDYSDYRVEAHFRATADIDTHDLVRRFRDQEPPGTPRHKFSRPDDFLAWLPKNAPVEEVTVPEVRLDDTETDMDRLAKSAAP